MPAGPTSLAELFAWPTFATQAIRSNDSLWSTLSANMERGIVLTTAWSGMRTAELVSSTIEEAFSRQVAEDAGKEVPLSSILNRGFVPGYSCDFDPTCISIATAWQSPHGKSNPCHFKDIMHRIPMDFVDVITAQLAGMPTRKKKCSRAEFESVRSARVGIYTHFNDFMFQRCDSIFKNGAVSECAVCGTDCDMSTSSDVDLVIEAVGNTCLGFTPFGLMEGMSHESSTPLIVWAAHTRSRRPAFILSECGVLFPTSFLEFWFSDLYAIQRQEPEPSLIGVPLWRPRAWHWCVRKDWELAGSFAHFVKLAERSVELNGDQFYIAPPDSIKAEFRRRAIKRGYGTLEMSDVKEACTQSILIDGFRRPPTRLSGRPPAA